MTGPLTRESSCDGQWRAADFVRAVLFHRSAVKADIGLTSDNRVAFWCVDLRHGHVVHHRQSRIGTTSASALSKLRDRSQDELAPRRRDPEATQSRSNSVLIRTFDQIRPAG